MDEYPKSVTKQCHEKILEQMNNSIGIIKLKDKNNEIGLVCKINYKDEKIPVLIINSLIKNKDYKEKINILLNKKNKEIELEEIIYKNKNDNISIIKIKKEQKNIKYIEIDDKLYKNDSEMPYNNDSIYILQYNNKNNISVLYGIIKEINNNKLIYNGSSNSNFTFSPIFNLSNNKLIGIHKNKNKLYNKGIILKNHINEFIDKYKYANKIKNKNYYNNNINEINITVNINKDDIHKKIFFLDNESKEKEGMIFYQLDAPNTELYINNKNVNLKNFLILKKKVYMK